MRNCGSGILIPGTRYSLPKMLYLSLKKKKNPKKNPKKYHQELRQGIPFSDSLIFDMMALGTKLYFIIYIPRSKDMNRILLKGLKRDSKKIFKRRKRGYEGEFKRTSN